MAAAIVTLRRWQAECIAKAFDRYRTDQHFLCLATPGAGKTKMAAALAKRLLNDGIVDLIVCFGPSIIVVDDFRVELEAQTGESMDGLIGSRGCAMTYQAMLNLPDNFWAKFSRHRVFAIFDEIHHCSGDTQESANAWGEKILCEIQGRAALTLALTGTPWRSDRIPIVLARYCIEQGRVSCDFQYGLSQSIQDGVCRLPNFIAVDNDKITVRENGQTTRQFNSIGNVLAESACTYQHLLENEALIGYLVLQADRKLNEIRRTSPDAGGLIVATSVAHAHQIADFLRSALGEQASIPTYFEDDAADVIREFKVSTQKWIISVGMISEGTNIPRLRVCCHLTRVKTELYFRQVLGRILRSTGHENEIAYLYMPAEPTLVEYAERLSEDIPSQDVIRFDTMSIHSDLSPIHSPVPQSMYDYQLTINVTRGVNSAPEIILPKIEYIPRSALAQSYESTLNLAGRFKQEVLALAFGCSQA